MKNFTLTIILLSISLTAFSQTPRMSLYEEFTGETVAANIKTVTTS
jgi:hypothetical protein